jgi:hypothetical protein
MAYHQYLRVALHQEDRRPANGLGSNKFNRLDFVVGLPKLDAIGPTLLIIRLGLGSTPYQFGVGVVWGVPNNF